jgi:hypothetical protein
MKKLTQWISGKQLMKKWNIDAIQIATLIEQGLPAYLNHEPYGIDEAGNYIEIAAWINEILFKPSDIEFFESENQGLINDSSENDMKLSAKDARLLGQLKREKETWDKSLAVAVQVGIFCAQEDREVKRDEIFDFVHQLDDKIPKTSIEKILKVIPAKYRKSAGAPQKK